MNISTVGVLFLALGMLLAVLLLFLFVFGVPLGFLMGQRVLVLQIGRSIVFDLPEHAVYDFFRGGVRGVGHQPHHVVLLQILKF